MLEDWIYFTMD